MNAPAKNPPLTPELHRKNLVKLLQAASRRHHLWEVFGDFVEMTAIAMANSVDLLQRNRREERYLALIRRYEPSEQKLFPQMLAELTLALEFGPDDVLGKVFGELELGNAARGQFFTPYCVCTLMARQQVGNGDDLRRLVAEKGFVTVCEPAAGAGAMVIAIAEAMQSQGVNYQLELHVTAQDIDARAVHMSYLQFSLLHIPAIVVLGNTLLAEEREHWYTPAHILGLWSAKLKRGYSVGSAFDRQTESPAETFTSPPPLSPAPLAQMLLF